MAEGQPTGTLEAAVARLQTPVEEEQPLTELDEEEEDNTPEPPAVEGDDAEDESDETSAEDGSDDTDPESFEVTVNGETRSVSLDDLRKGYMMESDYRQKTHGLAEQRRQLEADRQKLYARIQDMEAVVQLEQEDLTSDEALQLKDMDPEAYYQKRDRAEARAKRLEELKAEKRTNEQEALKTRIQEEGEKITTLIPEWLDVEKAQGEIKAMQQTWNQLGFTQEDIQTGIFLDARIMALSRKAALYDQLMAADPKPKRTTRATKSAEPGTATEPGDQESKRVKDAKARLRKTGKMDDAVGAIRALMRS